MNQKYSEISQYFSVFEGFPIILEKRTKRTKIHFLIRFCVGPFPFWGVSIAPLGAPQEYQYHFLSLIGMKNVHAKLEINIELLKQHFLLFNNTIYAFQICFEITIFLSRWMAIRSLVHYLLLVIEKCCSFLTCFGCSQNICPTIKGEDDYLPKPHFYLPLMILLNKLIFFLPELIKRTPSRRQLMFNF